MLAVERLDEIAANLCAVMESKKFVAGTRADGLRVFLDKIQSDDEDAELLSWLNEFRVQGRPEDVIVAVGLVRFIQITRSYCRTHSPQSWDAVEKKLQSLCKKGLNKPKKRGKGK